MKESQLVVKVVETLILKGIIPKEHREMAIKELDIEMKRHTQKVIAELASEASTATVLRKFLEG